MAEETSPVESYLPLSKSELQELLGPELMIESFTSRRLTQPGDNYFSNIQALEVTLLPHHRTLSLVAKLPPTSQFVREMSGFGKLLRKEARMYLEVSKLFQDIQMESNIPVEQVIDFLPKCYGAHVSYSEGKPVADKSVMLLENLGLRGYRCADRRIGLDFAHTDLVVSRLARFHATAIAVKIKKPLLFRNVVLPACENTIPENSPPPPRDGNGGKITDVLIELLESIQEIQPYVDKLKGSIDMKPDFSPPKEPFSSVVHCDFWTNNIIFGYNDDSALTDVMFIDFQMTRHDSPAKDLIFFLYSSTELGLLEEHHDHFIQLYHEQLTDQLRKLKCDVRPFSFDAFKGEIDRVASKELMHCLFMTNVITRETCDAPDVEQLHSMADMDKLISANKSSFYDKRVIQTITNFAKRGWF